MGLLFSCLNAPLNGVASVDVNQMLGTWYVVAVIPTPFEKNAFNPVEKYSWDANKKVIDVDFSFNQGSLDGPVKSIPQKLYPSGYPTANGKWLASPMWPIKLDYTIMDVAEDYSWVVVGHQSRKWFWLMGRDMTLPQPTIDAAVELGTKNGFAMANLVYPKHGAVSEKPM